MPTTKRKLPQKDEGCREKRRRHKKVWLELCFAPDEPRHVLSTAESELAKFQQEHGVARTFCVHHSPECKDATLLPGLEPSLATDEVWFLKRRLRGFNGDLPDHPLELRFDVLQRTEAFLGLAPIVASEAKWIGDIVGFTQQTRVRAAEFDVFVSQPEVDEDKFNELCQDSSFSWLARSKFLVHHKFGDQVLTFPFKGSIPAVVRRHLRPDIVVAAGEVVRANVDGLDAFAVSNEAELDVHVMGNHLEYFVRLLSNLRNAGYSLTYLKPTMVHATRPDSRSLNVILTVEVSNMQDLIRHLALDLNKAAFHDTQTVHVSIRAIRDWTTRTCHEDEMSTVDPSQLVMAQNNGFRLSTPFLAEREQPSLELSADQQCFFQDRLTRFRRFPVFNDKRFDFRLYCEKLAIVPGSGTFIASFDKPSALRMPRGVLRFDDTGDGFGLELSLRAWEHFRGKYNALVLQTRKLLGMELERPPVFLDRIIGMIPLPGVSEFFANNQAVDGKDALHELREGHYSELDVIAVPCYFMPRSSTLAWTPLSVSWTRVVAPESN